MNARWIGSLVLALLGAWAAAVSLPRMAPTDALWDFGSFVASGRAAAEGLNPYGVYPLTFRVEFPGFTADNPNLNPPISALLFQLFDLAEPHASFAVWRWISVAFYAATVALLMLRFGRGVERAFVGLWAIGLAGFWDTLFLGQIYLPLVFLAVAAWLLLERGRDVAAGVLIGLVVAMKPNFLVWPALLFLAGRPRPALAAGAVAAAVSAVPLAVYGWEVYRQWLELVASDRDRAFFLTNGSFSGLSSRLGAPALGPILSLALLLALAAWAYIRKPDVVRAGSFGLLASLLASPLGWIQYTLFLAPVLLAHRRNPAVQLVAAALLVPVPFVIAQFGKEAWTQATVGSVYGWALVLCLAALVFEEVRRAPGREAGTLRAPA
jgi:hypothetical protein